MGLFDLSYRVMAMERMLSFFHIDKTVVKDAIQDFGSKFSENMKDGQGIAGSAWNAMHDTVEEAVESAKEAGESTGINQDVAEDTGRAEMDIGENTSAYVKTMQDYAKSADSGTDLRNERTAQVLGNLCNNGYQGAGMEYGG